MSPRLFVASLLGAAVLYGQSITSSIVGTVHDNSGAVVPNATVSAVNLATNASSETHTDSSGNFVLLQLKPGSYTIDLTAPGFKKYVRSGLVLELQQQARIDADGKADVRQINQEIFDLCLAVASGERTCAERLGHKEFVPWRIGPVL